MNDRAQKTILLVEDENLTRLVMEEAIRGFGYRVVAATSGEEAVRLAAGKDPVDLVLMDINLGAGLDGPAAARQILAKRRLPIVFLTAHSEQEYVESVQAITRYGYVLKNCGNFVLRSSIAMAFELFEAHEALRREKQFAENLVKTAQVILVVLDVHGRIVSVNPYLEKISGYRQGEVAGRDWFEVFLPQEDRARIRELFLRAVGDLHTRGNINPIVAKDGRLIPVEWYDDTLKAADGSVAGLLAVGMDITERRRAEQALRENEMRIVTLSNNLVSGMIYQVIRRKDGSRKFTYLSDAVKRLYGISPQAGMDNADLVYGRVHPEDRQRVWQEEEAAARTLSVFKTEARMLDPSGAVRWSSFVSSPRRQEDGSICWDGMEFDITERKRAEAEREKLEAQLRRAHQLEAVGRLAGGVAHDFHNKLMVIQWCAETVLKGLPPQDPLRDELLEINQAVRHSTSLTKQLLAFSQRQAIAPVALDLNAGVAGSVKMLGHLLGENIRIQFEPRPDIGCVFMDPAQLDQVLVNLAVNARDAIAGVGRIAISLARVTLAEADCRGRVDVVKPGDYVALTFEDDGPGMTPEVQAHIFEPFFTTKAPGEGTGLGLATVYGIVRQNQGAITLRSAPGKGAAFTLYLPRLAGAAVKAAEETAAPMPNGTETVLIVEDEKAILSLAREALMERGYTVLAAATPGEALALCARHQAPIHLLLTDVVMPDQGGKELAERLKKIRPDIRVLFMSGYSAEIAEQSGHLAQGVRVLQKPFTLLQLAQEVRAVLDGRD